MEHWVGQIRSIYEPFYIINVIYWARWVDFHNFRNFEDFYSILMGFSEQILQPTISNVRRFLQSQCSIKLLSTLTTQRQRLLVELPKDGSTCKGSNFVEWSSYLITVGNFIFVTTVIDTYLHLQSSVPNNGCITFPTLGNSSSVGVRTIYMIDKNRLDPFTNNTQCKELLVSVFYPPSAKVPGPALIMNFATLVPHFQDSQLIIEWHSCCMRWTRGVWWDCQWNLPAPTDTLINQCWYFCQWINLPATGFLARFHQLPVDVHKRC